MADQIVIELIGDPSGLKPAEDALKELSKISGENMEAFNKANESMKKFQEALSEGSKKAGEATESTKKLGEAMKGISERADSVSKAAKAIDDLGTSATKSITAISGLNGVIAAGAIKTVTKDYQDHAGKVESLTQKTTELSAQLAQEKTKLEEMAAAGQKGSLAFITLEAQHRSTIGSLGGFTNSLNKAIEAQKNQSKAATDAATATGKNEKATGGFISRLKELSSSHKDAIDGTAKLLGHTSELTSAMGAVGEAVAHAAGNEDLAAEIKKKTALAIQAISTAQSVATAATEAGTVATTIFGTAAAAAWAAATLGVAALVAGIVALVANFDKVTHFFKKLWDPKTPKTYNEQLEDTIKKSQDLSDKAAKHVAELEAQGKSAKEINTAKQAQLNKETELLENQKKLAISEHDSTKQKELQNKLDENALGLIRLQTEAKKILNDEDDEAKNKKRKEIEDGQAKYAKILSSAKETADARLSITRAGSKEELAAKVADLNAAAALELNNAKNNASLVKAIRDKLRQDLSAAATDFQLHTLEDEKTGIEAKLVLAKKGSDDEYKLKMDILAKERELISANIKLTANEKLKADNEITQKELELKAELKAIEEGQKQATADTAKQKDKEVADNAIAEINKQLQATEEANDKLIAQKEKQKGSAKEIMQLKMANIKAEGKANEDLYAKGYIDFKTYTAKKIQLGKDATEVQKSQNKQLSDDQKKVAAEAIKAAQQVSDAIFANAQQRRDNELKATEDNLNAQKNAELLNTTLTASQRNAIEKKYKAEEAQAKLQAWKADQKAKEEQAIINGLLAFTTALAATPYPAGLVTGLLALAQAGVQAGIIASKTPPKFATGTPGSMVTPAGMKWVGEQGPELIYTPGGEKIMTNADSMALLEKYRIPNISGNVAQLLEGTGVHMSSAHNKEVVEAISSLRKDLKELKQVNVRIDEKGYRLSVQKGGNRTEYLNNEIKF